MRQGQQESGDYFRNRFNDNLYTIYLGVGSHILCRNDIMNKSGDNTTDKEIKL